jgi:rRNA maturation RNase YbeY
MILNRQRTVRIARPALESFLRRIRRQLRLGKAEVTIAFVTDAEIARLNRAYRKKQGPTDVLSFPAIAHRRPVRLPVAPALLFAQTQQVPVPTSTYPSRKHLATKRPTNVAAAFRGRRLSPACSHTKDEHLYPATPPNCHPDRSDPALSSAPHSRAGSRSGGTPARPPQSHTTASAAGPLPTRLSQSTQQAGFLGDIAISPATARRNAKKFGRSFPDELRILMLHGVLHLLGYDHETDTGQMERLEQKLRQQLRLA